MRYFVNPIFVILALIGLFFLTAVSWVLLNAEFLAFILILLYAGAITILLLFIIMLVEQKHIKIFENKNNKLLSILVSIVTISLISVLIMVIEDYNLKISIIINDKYIYTLGQVLFTNYLLPIIIVSLLLLSAVVATVCLKKYD